MTKVVDEYKSMTMEGMDLTPLELNLHKYDLVIISQIIKMIETDVFRHHKTFKSVLSSLQNMWTERNPQIGEYIHVLYKQYQK